MSNISYYENWPEHGYVDTNISFRSCFGHRLCSGIVIFTVSKIPHTISKTIVCLKSRALGQRRYNVPITTETCFFWFCFLITHVSDAKLYLSSESPIHRFASAIHISSLEKCILCLFTCFCSSSYCLASWESCVSPFSGTISFHFTDAYCSYILLTFLKYFKQWCQIMVLLLHLFLEPLT